MKIRIFGSNNCKDCLKSLILLKKSRLDFEYIDALDDRTQDICDENNVDELPHIQFLNDKNEIMIEHIGYIDQEDFMQYLINYEKRS